MQPTLASAPVGLTHAHHEWELYGLDEIDGSDIVFAVVGDLTAISSLRRRWPDATVVLLIPGRDVGGDVMRALRQGADVWCARTTLQ